MHNETRRRIISDPRLSNAAKVLGIFLLDNSSDGACTLNKPTMRMSCCLGKNETDYALQNLIALRYITMEAVKVGGTLPCGRKAHTQTGVFWIGEKPCAQDEDIKRAPLSPPPGPPTSIPPQNRWTNGQHETLSMYKLTNYEDKCQIDLTSKSSCWIGLWRLFKEVEFTTKSGALECVYDNVANPEPLCDFLSATYPQLPLGETMYEAAAWTAESKKNRRTKLGAFLRNWFRTAAKNNIQREPLAKNDFVPYHRPL